ncbi:MAG: hypothetical protein D6775_08700 [Caldilineae bacterium]|nr:MAG: hypothetical protein D6775_08700 [Caldilineae bacterium]
MSPFAVDGQFLCDYTARRWFGFRGGVAGVLVLVAQRGSQHGQSERASFLGGFVESTAGAEHDVE